VTEKFPENARRAAVRRGCRPGYGQDADRPELAVRRAGRRGARGGGGSARL